MVQYRAWLFLKFFSNSGCMLSKSFMQFSAGLTIVNLVAVFTSNGINYSFCSTIMVTDYCDILVPSVFYSSGF